MEKLCELVGVDLANSTIPFSPGVYNPNSVMAVIEERRRDNDTESARQRRGR